MKYFGTDGFRGRANDVLTAEHAFRIGRFLGYAASGKRRGRVVIGKDTRRSSYMLEYALAAGVTASGADAYLLHVTTTASVSYLVRAEGFDYGVMISASHNSFEDNGIKLIASGGEKCPDDVLLRAERCLEGEFKLPLATGEDIGCTVDFVAGRNRYLGFLLSLASGSFRGYRVGLDCANGSAWALARTVFEALGAEVHAIGVSPDGFNINKNCGSTHPAALQKLVLAEGLDLGFAFDGDADRCIAVDERGRIVDGDGILYLSARAMKARGEAVTGVVGTVMSNLGLVRSLEREGIPCYLTDVGDRFVAEEMASRGCMLGGEPSGHVIFRKYAATGDGILTALMVMEAVRRAKCSLSCLVEGLERLPRVEKNVRVVDKRAAMSAANGVLERAKSLLKDGRVLVRPSGTEPFIRILAEGEDAAACGEAAELLARAIADAEGGVCAGS